MTVRKSMTRKAGSTGGLPILAGPDGSMSDDGPYAVEIAASKKLKVSLGAWLRPGVTEHQALERAIDFVYNEGGGGIVMPVKPLIGGVVQPYALDAYRPRRFVTIDQNRQTVRLNNGINANLLYPYDDDSVGWTVENGIVDANSFGNTFTGDAIWLSRDTYGDVSGRYYDAFIRLNNLRIQNARKANLTVRSHMRECRFNDLLINRGEFGWQNMGARQLSSLSFNGSVSAAKGATLSVPWALNSGKYAVTFSSGEARDVTMTKGGTEATWTDQNAVTAGPSFTVTIPGATDNFYNTITSYQNKLGNILLEGANIKGNGIKSFGAGDADDLASIGIECRGLRRSVLSQVETQEEGGKGLVFSTDAQNNSVFGLITDANGTSGFTGEKYCLEFRDACENNVVERFSQGNFKPSAYATEGVHMSTTGANNKVNGTSSSAIPTNKWAVVESNVKASNQIVINNVRRFGVANLDDVVDIPAARFKAVSGSPSDGIYAGGRAVGFAFDQTVEEQAFFSFRKEVGFDKITVVINWVSPSVTGNVAWFCDFAYAAPGSTNDFTPTIKSNSATYASAAANIGNENTLIGESGAFIDISSIPNGARVRGRVKRVITGVSGNMAADAIIEGIKIVPYLL